MDEPARQRATEALRVHVPALADNAVEAILAYVEGLFVIAKARNEPAVFKRMPRDVARLLGART
jgi:hypothetical protein